MTHVAAADSWVGETDLSVEVRAIQVDLATVVVDDFACLDRT